MANKYLIVLVTAFNPLSSHVTTFGDKRLKQHVWGFERLRELSQAYPAFDYLLVDNTIPQGWQEPEALRAAIDSLPGLQRIYFQDTTGLPARNKGCGVLMNLQRAFKERDLSGYEYVLYFEPRQFLLDFEFFKRFLQSPDNYFATVRFRITAATKAWWVRALLKLVPLIRTQYNVGLFSLKTSLFRQYLDRVDIDRLARVPISMEDDMYAQLPKGEIRLVPRLGILWHNASEDAYVPY